MIEPAAAPGLSYFLADHLGSTSLITNAAGALISETRYSAWGEVRYQAGTMSTNYTYTGQYSNVPDFGLMFYNARWLDPALGRFAQPDSLVPGGAQGLDRYAYVNNSPVNFTDPSGHKYCDSQSADNCSRFSNSVEDVARMYGILFRGNWSLNNQVAAIEGVEAVGAEFAAILGGTSSGAFRSVYQKNITFAWVDSYTDYQGNIYYSGAITKSATRIEFASMTVPVGERTLAVAFTSARNNVIHELGHAFASLWFNKGGYDPSGPYANIPGDKKFLSNDGFYSSPVSANLTWRQHPCTGSDYACANEVFADMFLGWTFDKWGGGDMGESRQAFMATNMAEWISAATQR